MQKNVEINRASFLAFLYEFKYAILFFVIGDTLTTIYSLSTQIGYEYNGLISPIIERFGIYSLILPKLAFTLLLFALYVYASRFTLLRVKWIVASIGFVVTMNNLMAIFYGIALFQILNIV